MGGYHDPSVVQGILHGDAVVGVFDQELADEILGVVADLLPEVVFDVVLAIEDVLDDFLGELGVEGEET